MYFVYVLISEKDGQYYIGQTNNLESRIRRHNLGYVHSTINRRPLRLVYTEEFMNRSEAMHREKYLKSGAGHKYLEQELADTARETGSE